VPNNQTVAGIGTALGGIISKVVVSPPLIGIGITLNFSPNTCKSIVARLPKHDPTGHNVDQDIIAIVLETVAPRTEDNVAISEPERGVINHSTEAM